MGDFETLTLERVGDVLRVTIAHPTSALNAVDERLHSDLTALFARLRREPEARAVVLTGRGRAFSAGGDFAWFPELRDMTKLDALRRDAKQLIWDLLDVELPIVAAVNGHAMGLGASIALLCDVIFMADTATIGDPHVKVGLVAGDGGAVIWPQLVGFARAKEFLMTGEMLSATRAAEMGLINYAVPGDQLDSKVAEVVGKILANPRWAVRWTKTAANIPLKMLANQISDAAIAYETLSNLTKDRSEAVAAFVEKRKPIFSGE